MKALISLFLLLAASAAQAQTAPVEKDSDKLDIKQLEDRYWSSKDDDFSVVQNRTFSKAKKFSLTLGSGMPINDPYSTGGIQNMQIGYHFNERWGVELGYLGATFRDNEVTDRFIKDHGTIPNHNKLQSQTSLQVNFVPLYAKMSFLDKRIIYFDMGFSLGIGQTTYASMVNTGDRTQQGSLVQFGIYQHYFLREWVALKVEYRNTWTMEERFRYKMNPGEQESARSLGEKSINDTSLMIGFTFFK